jgi:hypothetical protein
MRGTSGGSPHVSKRYWETAEFAALQSQWYGALRGEGFVDIEGADGLEEPGGRRRRERVDWEATAEYYRMAGVFLHDHQFESAIERRIWELHCEGMSHRRIVRELGNRYKHRVLATIGRLRRTMLAGGRARARA